MIAAADRKRRLGGQKLPRLLDLALAREDESGKDQRLRASPAFGEAALDEQLVGADAERHRDVIARFPATIT